MPIRRLYRKTIEDMVDLTGTTLHHPGKKNHVCAYLHSLNHQRTW